MYVVFFNFDGREEPVELMKYYLTTNINITSNGETKRAKTSKIHLLIRVSNPNMI